MGDGGKGAEIFKPGLDGIRIFISFAPDATDLASALEGYLTGLGVHVNHSGDMESGWYTRDYVDRSIKKSEIFVALVSAEYASSGRGINDLATFLVRNEDERRMIASVVSDVGVDVPPLLRPYASFDLTAALGNGGGVEELGAISLWLSNLALRSPGMDDVAVARRVIMHKAESLQRAKHLYALSLWHEHRLVVSSVRAVLGPMFAAASVGTILIWTQGMSSNDIATIFLAFGIVIVAVSALGIRNYRARVAKSGSPVPSRADVAFYRELYSDSRSSGTDAGLNGHGYTEKNSNRRCRS